MDSILQGYRIHFGGMVDWKPLGAYVLDNNLMDLSILENPEEYRQEIERIEFLIRDVLTWGDKEQAAKRLLGMYESGFWKWKHASHLLRKAQAELEQLRAEVSRTND